VTGQDTGLREQILNLLRRLFWIRSYEVALVPAGANGVEDFLDGVKSLGGLDARVGPVDEGQKWVQLGEAITALGTGLKSGDMPGMEQALADALDAVMEGLGALGGAEAAVPKTDGEMMTQIGQALHGLKMEGLLLQGQNPAAAASVLKLSQSIADLLPVSDGTMAIGEKGQPAAGKPGGHKTPPKGYPTDPALFLDSENWKYPVDTEARTRAAITYLSREKPGGTYTRDELVWMWNRLRDAARKYSIEMAEDTGVKGVKMDTGSIKMVMTKPMDGVLMMDGQKVTDLQASMGYTMPEVAVGEHTVEITKDGKPVFSAPATVAAGQESDLVVEVEPSETVVDGEDIAEGEGVMACAADTAAKEAPAAEVTPAPVPTPAPAVEVKADVTAPAEDATALLLKSLNEAVASLGQKMAEQATQLTDLATRFAAGQKADADAALAKAAGEKADADAAAVAAAVKAEAAAADAAAGDMLLVPGAAPITEDKTAEGAKSARDDLNEDDLSSSPRLKSIRENLAKGGLPPLV